MPTPSAAARRIDAPDGPTVTVLWLGEPDASRREVVGGKAAGLSRLTARHRVPPGFVLALEGAELPAAARSQVAAAYRRLGALTGEEHPTVAVRSSAVDEDGAEASFAGQHDTFLNLSGPEQVWWAVARCVASFAGERAAGYRRGRGLAPAPARTAVLVQQLVAADAAGVAFSAHPVTGARDEVVVTASWGLGESVVAGTVTPDTYVVDRRDGALRSRTIGAKERMTIPAADGVREVPVPGRLARMAVLDDDRAREAAMLAVVLERETGHPVDLELAWRGPDLFLLQCRPITTLQDPRSPR
jgi:phosphoenolpyruvate synthase/pyruvate phosphate dikinase